MPLTEKVLKIIFDEQRDKAIKRFNQRKKRDAFVKRRLKKIVSLSMEGWPRTKNMKDYPKWLDLVFEAKIKRVYGFGTSNCDVISQLHYKAKELSQLKK